MRVFASFDDLTDDAASDLGDAFWLVDSPSNRKLAEDAYAAKHYAPNSAIFNQPIDGIDISDVVELVEDIDLHHPTWREITIVGVALNLELETELTKLGSILMHGPERFSLVR